MPVNGVAGTYDVTKEQRRLVQTVTYYQPPVFLGKKKLLVPNTYVIRGKGRRIVVVFVDIPRFNRIELGTKSRITAGEEKQLWVVCSNSLVGIVIFYHF